MRPLVRAWLSHFKLKSRTNYFNSIANRHSYHLPPLGAMDQKILFFSLTASFGSKLCKSDKDASKQFHVQE